MLAGHDSPAAALSHGLGLGLAKPRHLPGLPPPPSQGSSLLGGGDHLKAEAPLNVLAGLHSAQPQIFHNNRGIILGRDG